MVKGNTVSVQEKKKRSQSLALHGAQETQKCSLPALLGNWLFYCTYSPKNKRAMDWEAGRDLYEATA